MIKLQPLIKKRQDKIDSISPLNKAGIVELLMEIWDIFAIIKVTMFLIYTILASRIIKLCTHFQTYN